jgi:hypothetical protein
MPGRLPVKSPRFWIRQGWRAILIVGLVLLSPRILLAQTLTVSGSPGSLRISTAVAGFPPDPANDATTTYTVKSKNKNSAVKIMAQLDSPMPPGVTLTVEFVAPSGATSDGPVTLDATAREVVGGIASPKSQTSSITYTLTATPAAGVVPPESRVVTLTLTDWP